MNTYYKNWLEKNGTAFKVIKLRFIDFDRCPKKGKILKFADSKNSIYACGIYECVILNTNEIKPLKFRMVLNEKSEKAEVGWNYTSFFDAIIDKTTDYLNCDLETFRSGEIGLKYESEGLKRDLINHYNLLLKLETIKNIYSKLTELCSLKIDYLSSPSNQNLRAVKEYISKNENLNEELKSYLNNHEYLYQLTKTY
jgi:hypothetical protein